MDDLKKLISSANLSGIIQLMFKRDAKIPVIREGFYHERSLWDYKSEVPGSGKPHESAWADIARHVLAFHNAEGGVIIFGIDDKTFLFKGASNYCDSARFNASIRKYVGDLFHVVFSREFIQSNQSYLGIAMIPARGPRVVRFASNAPKTVEGKISFSKGDLAVREGDSSIIYKGSNAANYINGLSLPKVGRGYFVDEENYRVLTPEYRNFVYRRELCEKVMEGLYHPRVAVTSLTGIGGVGKTALATWAAVECYKDNSFEFIVSITAKDRELTAKSIVPLERSLTSYEQLIETILRVLRLDFDPDDSMESKELFILDLLEDSNGLIYIDNLETVDDVRIINFLESLPLGVRALVTSRIPRVRTSNYPVDVKPLSDYEIIEFIDAMCGEREFAYLSNLDSGKKLLFGTQCNGIPLAMRWVAARCQSPQQALIHAKEINNRSLTNEELLEFSFRRIFENLSKDETSILNVLSIYNNPISAEAIHIATGISYQIVGDTVVGLQNSSLIEPVYDDEINDFVYTMLPITRSFVYGEVRRQKGLEDEIRRRMRDWFEAKEIQDPVWRAIARQVRQGQKSSEEVTLQLARQAANKNNLGDAEKLYGEAIRKSPTSWNAHRAYAEFLRHSAKEMTKALQHYSLAAQYVKTKDKHNAALIYREYGILLKQSGNPDGLQESIKFLNVSFDMNPYDPITVNVLADNLRRVGEFQKAIKLLENFKKRDLDNNSKEHILSTLQLCYEESGDMVAAILVKRELTDLKNFQK